LDFTSIMQTMPASLDLYILPLARQNGIDQPALPGIYTALPPRRAARGREADYLLLYLTLAGSAPLPAEQMLALMEDLAERYFKTPGTATAAMRTAAEALNQYLLDRNVRSANTGRQSTGWLSQVVLRSDMLYIAHSGPVHAYVLSGAEPRHLYDPASSGRGLGLTHQVSLRYFHATLQPGQFVLLAHQPSSSWEGEVLSFTPNQGMEQVRRRLVGRPDLDLSAVLVQAQEGTGKLNLLRLRTPTTDMAHPGPASSARPASAGASSVTPESRPVTVTGTGEAGEKVVASNATAGTKTDAPVLATPSVVPSITPSASSAPSVTGVAATQMPASSPQRAGSSQPASARPTAVQPVPEAGPVQLHGAGARQPGHPATTTVPKPARPPSQVGVKAKKAFATLFLGLRAFWRAIKNTLRQAGGSFVTLLRRVLPDETMLDVSPSTLAFLVLAVPLLIGVVGAVVYIERGQQAQYQSYYEQALQQAASAQGQTDLNEQRSGWNAVLNTLNQADLYQVTSESQQLRLQARSVLDGMDYIQRLDYQPAIIGGLDPQVRITRMAATDSLTTNGELYMLDRSEGRVLRAINTGGGYQLDTSFNCGPMPGPVYVGPLVDIAVLPAPTEQGATMIAMDENRVLLFCIPGGQPLTQQIAPPTTNFGTPRAFDLNEGDLYLLDPSANAVWIYRNMDFSQPPRLFFGDEIPFMADVIDLVVNKDDLYLLHTDGHITRCSYSGMAGAPTRCEDPMPYTDRRPGRQSGPIISDAVFDQIYFAPPPDPSLYLLDPANQAVFHMGLQLSFQSQYRPNQALPQSNATAFAVSPTRLMFLAIGSQVYYAGIP
jgi:hypothetical protein